MWYSDVPMIDSTIANRFISLKIWYAMVFVQQMLFITI